MTYDEFLHANRNKLLGYFMLGEFLKEPDILDTPDPAAELSEQKLAELKDRINECMPLDSMITDLWDWDIHFEEYLSDDWYFAAVFGSPSSLGSCAEQLAEFFVEKCNGHDMDYDQTPDDPEFGSRIREQAANFVLGWRRNVFARHAQPGASGDAPEAARP